MPVIIFITGSTRRFAADTSVTTRGYLGYQASSFLVGFTGPGIEHTVESELVFSLTFLAVSLRFLDNDRCSHLDTPTFPPARVSCLLMRTLHSFSHDLLQWQLHFLKPRRRSVLWFRHAFLRAIPGRLFRLLLGDGFQFLVGSRGM